MLVGVAKKRRPSWGFVGCNNRKLYYIEMYCLLLVVTTGDYIILKCIVYCWL